MLKGYGLSKVKDAEAKYHKLAFIVCPEIRRHVILSCEDQKKMGILGKSFPNVPLRRNKEESIVYLHIIFRRNYHIHLNLI
jgi:hypothetical protein